MASTFIKFMVLSEKTTNAFNMLYFLQPYVTDLSLMGSFYDTFYSVLHSKRCKRCCHGNKIFANVINIMKMDKHTC